jgi:hypothetical protein
VRALLSKAWELSVPERLLGLALLVLFFAAPFLRSYGVRGDRTETGFEQLRWFISRTGQHVSDERKYLEGTPGFEYDTLTDAMVLRAFVASFGLVPLAALVVIAAPRSRWPRAARVAALGGAAGLMTTIAFPRIVDGSNFVFRYLFRDREHYARDATLIVALELLPLAVALAIAAGILARWKRVVWAERVFAVACLVLVAATPRLLYGSGTNRVVTAWAYAACAAFPLVILLESLRRPPLPESTPET